MNIHRNAFSLLLLMAAVFVVVDDSIAQPQARKLAELTTVASSDRAKDEEVNRQIQLYARRLQKEKAHAYIIGYAPRVIVKEFYHRTYGEVIAVQSASRLAGFFDYRRIHSIDGGFRETATTELWLVPPGASPPKPTPSVKPEDVTHCPKLNIRGSTYIPRPNGPMEFNVRLHADAMKIEPVFTWQLSQGTVIEGQGTERIKVAVPAGASGKVIARVNVSGFSPECPARSTTAATATIVGIDHIKFDEYGEVCSEDEKARLDNYAIELLRNPDLQAYIVFYGGRCWSPCSADYPDHGPRYPRKGGAETRAGRIKPFLVDVRGVDADRIIVIDGGNRESWTAELWLSAKGIAPPPATPTVAREDIKYGKGKPAKREFCRGRN